MAPPHHTCLPLPAPLSLTGSAAGERGGSAPGAAAAATSSLASRLRLHAAIAGISAALTELNSTVESMGGGKGRGLGWSVCGPSRRARGEGGERGD